MEVSNKHRRTKAVQNDLDENINLEASIQITRESLYKSLKRRSSKIYDNNNKIIESQNHKLILEKILNEFSGRNSIIKRVFSMPNISKLNVKSKQNQNIINELNEDKNNQIIENDNNIHNIKNINIIEDEIEINNKKARSNSFSNKNEMTNKYYEENEKINNNIFIDKFSYKIKKISTNLLLQKIVLEDFLRKQNDMMNHFCQQCFCFIKVDIFFEKIMNCYKYYTKKNIKIEKLMNLIDFFNALIIEMIEYYKEISKNDLKVINKVYNTILSDLIKNINNNNISNIYNKKTKKELKDLKDSKDSKVIKKAYNKVISDLFKNINNNNNINNKISKKDLLNKDLRCNNKKKYIHFKNNKKNIIKEEDYDIVIIEKQQYFFLEKIYNEQKEMNKFINDTFKIEKFFDSRNLDNCCINQIEKIIINIKKILSLFKCKNPIDELPKARNLINFYKYLKKGKINNHDKNVNAIIYYENNQEKRSYMSKGFFTLFDWSVKEVGDELIRVTDKLLNKIEKKELYRAKYLKKDKEKTSPNVHENINYSNNLTTFIIEDIASYDHPKDRAKILDKWARIADYCRSKRDYNDCFAINTAINSFYIKFLKKTHKKLNTKHIKNINIIKDFCNISGNYKNAREEINKLNSQNEYYYPFLGMILRDINFYEESSKYLIDGELINFEKIENIQNILENNFYFKYLDNTKIQSYKKELFFFEKLEKYSEDYLESIVDEIEPKFTRNNGKKKFKKLTKIDKKYLLSAYKNKNDF